MADLRRIFPLIDKFVKHLFDTNSPLLQDYYGISGPCPAMSLADTLKIVALYHHKSFPFKHFKGFYNHVRQYLIKMFPNLPSYSRMICLRNKVCRIMDALLDLNKEEATDDNIIDSTKMPTTKEHRGNRMRQSLTDANFGHTWSGRFFGYKSHRDNFWSAQRST